MKNIIFLLSFLVLSSCSVNKYILESSVVDLSEYSQSGFLITYGDYSEQFKSLGIIKTINKDGYDYKNERKEKLGLSYNRKANVNEAIRSTVEKCNEIGADGILFLKIDYLPDGIVVSGMAIKR